MLIAKFRISAHPGTEQEIKEILSMACEFLGPATVKEIENNDTGMHITVHIDAPGGSVQIFKKQLAPHLKQFRDTQLNLLEERLPEQIHL